MLSLFSAITAAVTIVAAIAPPIHLPGGSRADEGRFPAPPGYVLPWAGGEIQAVTQGEETTFTHNGVTAYAFDFDLSYDTIVAARSGRVAMVREDSNKGGCSAAYASAANYVVIDHGDGTSALYLHLAHNGVSVALGDIVAQGDPIGVSGETGITCSEDEGGPGPHLHFQVERTNPLRPLTQSLPIAFDDIPTNKGVPEEGRSYVSGNFGPGRPQKVKLTQWRAPRSFHPTARPASSSLLEEPLPPTPSPVPQTPEPERLETPTATPEPPTLTPVPDDTATPRNETDTPVPTNTPVPTPTTLPATPTVASTPPAATETPEPPTETPAETPSPTSSSP